jgi:hypothetical protein
MKMKQNRLVKNKEFLVLLSKSKPKLRKALLSGCNKESIYSIIECILNVCNGNVHINSDEFNKLKPYNKTFKKLIDRKVDLNQKKNIIIQKGGFLEVLIPAIISGIASIISSAIANN